MEACRRGQWRGRSASTALKGSCVDIGLYCDEGEYPSNEVTDRATRDSGCLLERKKEIH
jgi:hypothetical protein